MQAHAQGNRHGRTEIGITDRSPGGVKKEEVLENDSLERNKVVASCDVLQLFAFDKVPGPKSRVITCLLRQWAGVWRAQLRSCDQLVISQSVSIGVNEQAPKGNDSIEKG